MVSRNLSNIQKVHSIRTAALNCVCGHFNRRCSLRLTDNVACLIAGIAKAPDVNALTPPPPKPPDHCRRSCSLLAIFYSRVFVVLLVVVDVILPHRFIHYQQTLYLLLWYYSRTALLEIKHKRDSGVMMLANSPSTSSSPEASEELSIFKIGPDDADVGEAERLMYNAISSYSSLSSPQVSRKRKKTKLVERVFRPISDDWFYLLLLGASTALCSLTMEFAIERLAEWQIAMYDRAALIEAKNHYAYTFFVWTGYAVFLVVCSAAFAHYFSPQAIGSGIPEMKTIMRGFVLKEYLSLRTLVCKMIGLTLSLGSGLPLGKEGPFVHVSSAVASQLSRFMIGEEGAYANESRSQELLAAGCAVGVACTFSTPIGGVLFSIEVTSAYFAVRNYWRGFIAALCAATTFRIVRLIAKSSEVTVMAYGQTRFPDESYFPEEIPVFAFVGLLCGLGGALFIKCHRSLVLFLTKSRLCKAFMAKHWLLYPLSMSFVAASITYPKGLGQFLSGRHRFSQTLLMFLSNCTWSAGPGRVESCATGFLDQWNGSGTNSVCITLLFFTVTFFVLSMVGSTLPIPAGIFMPVFVIGASFGRLVGETMAILFPDGIRSNYTLLIHPGVYGVVGAASFCGAVTHTISVAVIVFEFTGQLMHILPVMIAVIVANVVCSYFQPSIYDSIIIIKELPYLPEVSHCSPDFHSIVAEQIMVTDLKYIWKDMTYFEMKSMIESNRRLKSFPVVLDKESLILLGSVSKKVLSDLIENKVGPQARQLEAARRLQTAVVSQDCRNLSSASVEYHNEMEPSKHFYTRKYYSSAQLPLLGKRSQNSNAEHSNSRCSKLLHCVAVDGSCSECDKVFKKAARVEKELSRVLSEQRKTSFTDTTKKICSDVLRRSLYRITYPRRKKGMFDLYGEERAQWEVEQLSSTLDLLPCHMDPAPFQLVENTSIFKIHSVFSLLGLRRAYVTKFGRLVGVVSLKELRAAIENINSTPATSLSAADEANEAMLSVNHV
ncbi:unnamed protein product [Cylicocyclus nassatus]|uniref:Chloride channel protein n=1 Tax=Cylicocyclus nassatus TaxID=53992 RepID=A0AA36GVI9_CYLNA|nr:unnamed protein product [Cylicocyclus nassatus]